MVKKFTAAQFALQKEFGVEALGQRMSEVVIRGELSDRDRAFIDTRDFFFLATVDAEGQPTCSYKGGLPGFVRSHGPNELTFPLFNGNSMYLSAGNMQETAKVGLLFIDFETPHRLRIEGSVRLSRSAEDLNAWPGAELTVRVSVAAVFVNCPRYIHRAGRLEASKYVPRDGSPAPLPAWKRIEGFQDVLPVTDRPRVAEYGGVISPEEYLGKLMRGDA